MGFSSHFGWVSVSSPCGGLHFASGGFPLALGEVSTRPGLSCSSFFGGEGSGSSVGVRDGVGEVLARHRVLLRSLCVLVSLASLPLSLPVPFKQIHKSTQSVSRRMPARGSGHRHCAWGVFSEGGFEGWVSLRPQVGLRFEIFGRWSAGVQLALRAGSRSSHGSVFAFQICRRGYAGLSWPSGGRQPDFMFILSRLCEFQFAGGVGSRSLDGISLVLWQGTPAILPSVLAISATAPAGYAR